MKLLIMIIVLLLPIVVRSETPVENSPKSLDAITTRHGKQLQEVLAQQKFPPKKIGLFTQMPSPEVVTDGLGLLVERDFGNRGEQ